MLSQASSDADLLAQLVGLLGIFGVFGTALATLDTFVEAHQVVLKKVSSKRSVAKDKQPETSGDGEKIDVSARRPMPPSAQNVTPPAQSHAGAVGMPPRVALASIGVRVLTPAATRGAPPTDHLDAIAAADAAKLKPYDLL